MKLIMHDEVKESVENESKEQNEHSAGKNHHDNNYKNELQYLPVFDVKDE